MQSSFESPPVVPLAIRHIPLDIGWPNFSTEVMPVGVFGTTEEFEALSVEVVFC